MRPRLAKIDQALATEAPKGAILAIEDDPATIADLVRILGAGGYACHCCRDLASAVEQLSAVSPQLIIADLGIAGPGGRLLAEALAALSGEGTSGARLAAALRRIERQSSLAPDLLAPVAEALERVLTETEAARAKLEAALAAASFEPQELERAEERLFALRALARKHKVAVDDLPALLVRLEAELAALEKSHGVRIYILADGRLIPDEYEFELERRKDAPPAAAIPPPPPPPPPSPEEEEEEADELEEAVASATPSPGGNAMHRPRLRGSRLRVTRKPKETAEQGE